MAKGSRRPTSSGLLANSRGTRTSFADALQRHFSPVFSWKTEDGNCYRMSNDVYKWRLNGPGGFRFRWENSVALYHLNAHEAGRSGLKVTSRFGGITIIYFDLDRHNFGSIEDIRRLAGIIQKDFPELTCEFVFSERGGSGGAGSTPEGMTGSNQRPARPPSGTLPNPRGETRPRHRIHRGEGSGLRALLSQEYAVIARP